jgi:hypothetical protein
MKLNENQKEMYSNYGCTEGKELVLCDGCGLLFCTNDYLVKNETHVCLCCINGIK